jgi:hypothetical protein
MRNKPGKNNIVTDQELQDAIKAIAIVRSKIEPSDDGLCFVLKVAMVGLLEELYGMDIADIILSWKDISGKGL